MKSLQNYGNCFRTIHCRYFGIETDRVRHELILQRLPMLFGSGRNNSIVYNTHCCGTPRGTGGNNNHRKKRFCCSGRMDGRRCSPEANVGTLSAFTGPQILTLCKMLAQHIHRALRRPRHEFCWHWRYRGSRRIGWTSWLHTTILTLCSSRIHQWRNASGSYNDRHSQQQ